MTIAATFVIAAALNNHAALVTVKSVDRVEIFAGKLGREIRETLTVESEGKTYTIRLGKAHTKFGATTEFKSGDSIRIRGWHGSSSVLRDQISKA